MLRGSFSVCNLSELLLGVVTPRSGCFVMCEPE